MNKHTQKKYWTQAKRFEFKQNLHERETRPKPLPDGEHSIPEGVAHLSYLKGTGAHLTSSSSARVTLRLTCSMEFADYPFDEQVCGSVISSCEYQGCLDWFPLSCLSFPSLTIPPIPFPYLPHAFHYPPITIPLFPLSYLTFLYFS